MADIRLKRITVEPLQSPLVIQKGNINITSTNVSESSITGSIIVDGGIGINSSYDSVSCTAGGSLTVGGGASVLKTLQVGKNVVLDSSNGEFHVKGLTIDRFFVDNISNGYISFAPNGVNKQVEITNTYVKMSSVLPSSNWSTGALVMNGGLSINTSVDSESVSSGGALSIAGGASINKKLFVGSGISSSVSNTIGSLFTTAGNVGIGTVSPLSRLSISSSTEESKITLWDGGDTLNHFGFGIGNQQLNYHISNTSSNHIFYATGKNGNGNELLRVSGNGKIGVGTSSPSYTMDINGTLRVSSNVSMASGTNTMGTIFTTGGNVGVGTVTPGTRLDVNGGIQGTSMDIIGSTSATYMTIRSDISGIRLFEYGMTQGSGMYYDKQTTMMHVGMYETPNTFNKVISVTSSGSVGISTTSPSSKMDVNGLITAIGLASSSNSNTLGSLFTTNGNVGIGVTTPAAKLDVKTSTSGEGNVVAKFGGNTSLKIYDSQTSQTRGPKLQFDSVNVGVIEGMGDLALLPSGNLGIGTTSSSYKLDLNGSLRVTNGSLIATGDTNTLGSLISTGGNIGIGVTNPGYRLDVNGTFGVSGDCVFTSTTPSNISSGSLVLSGGVSILNTSDASSVSSGGALTIRGGASINRNLIVGSNITVLDTTASSSVSSGAIVMNGGLSINQTSNASTIGNGGALTVAGGASIGGDLFLNGSFFGQSSASFSTLSLTSTSASSLTCAGGINIQSTKNAVSVTDGGSLTVLGGASFKGDTYIQGTSYKYGSTNYYPVTNDVISFYDSTQTKRYSLDMNATSRLYSLSRYNTSGNLIERIFEVGSTSGSFTFNNTTSSSSSSVASVIIKGGVSISSTGAATTTSNGGSITVSGGIGVAKNMLIGGNVRIFSTTQSTDVSSGSFIVDGGVGIAGALNVLGNTTVNGDLTVRGSTTTVNSVNTVLKDNLLMLNSGPSGSKDSGVLIQRYQQDNNTGTGDVVNDSLYISDLLPNQSGVLSTQVKLSTNSSSIDNYYVGWWIKVASGFSSSQVRKITGYVGSTRLATLSSAWNTQNPSTGDYVYLYNKPYVGLIYNELNDKFEFGAVVGDPGETNVDITERLPIQFSTASATSTQGSTSITAGALIMQGGISIANSTNATALTAGGSFTSLGGASIGKSLYVGNSCVILSTEQSTGVGTGGSFTVLGGGSISKDLYVGGTITSSSDIRLKKNVTNFKSGTDKMLDLIDDIQTVKFTYINDPDENQTVGFIAQDFVEHFPELVRKPNTDGYYTLDYQKISVILMECIKELKEEIRKLK
jgi:hypothetical protein